jgi:hypothetical protein
MFGGRREKRIAETSLPSWNGWTQALLDAINGRDNLELLISSMHVSWSFDAARFSEAVHLDELDEQGYHDMPGIADKPLVRYQDKMPYPEIEATCKAKEVYRGIDSEIEISQAAKRYPLSYVSEKGLVGHIIINATDSTTLKTKGQEWKTPLLSVSIQDLDCQLVSALRNSLRAARLQQTRPRLRIFLAEKFKVSVSALLQDQANMRVGLKQIVLWEMWE